MKNLYYRFVNITVSTEKVCFIYLFYRNLWNSYIGARHYGNSWDTRLKDNYSVGTNSDVESRHTCKQLASSDICVYMKLCSFRERDTKSI